MTTDQPGPDAAPASGAPANPRRWRLLGVLAVAQLMLILDVTVVAIALPHMGADLGLDREALTWVVSGYTLAFGGLLLLGGRTADVFGARRVVLLGLGAFTAASLVAGLAVSGPMLLAGRVAQGVAAALLSPAALSLVVTLFDGDERNRALGIWSALGGAGAAVGVLLGGVLTAGPGWPWVFYVNVPIGILALVVLARQLPPRPPAGAVPSLDVPGALLVTAATGTLIAALIRVGDQGWTAPGTALLLLAAIVLYAGFAVRLRRAASPLVAARVLTGRPVVAGSLLILVATALMMTAFFLGTFALQTYRGFDALTSGLAFLPVALATMAGANLAGRVIARTGARALGTLGLLVAGAGMALPAIGDSTGMLVTGLGVAGAGTGAVFVVAAATALGHVDPADAGTASGVLSTFHEFGASLGAAAVSSIAAVGIATDVAAGASAGFRAGFTAAAVTAVVAAAITVVIMTGRPS